jgi:hypothetical protein
VYIWGLGDDKFLEVVSLQYYRGDTSQVSTSYFEIFSENFVSSKKRKFIAVPINVLLNFFSN